MPDGQEPKKTGRGTLDNPTGRFERLKYSRDEACEPDLDQDPSPQTQFYQDHSRSIISTNNSPDVGFGASLNPYRGCEHGCIYCYARPTHEYFGLSAGLDFESKIFAKPDAARLLRQELSAPRWKPQVLVMSGVTDPYQPVERHLKITRACLEVLREFRNPVGIITKNPLVQRDADILGEMAGLNLASAAVSVTSLDLQLAKQMEPRAGRPAHRLAAIRALAAAGVPVTVMAAPMIPGLNDHELPAILKAAAEAGARKAGYVLLRLPWGLKDLFEGWLAEHFPDRKDKVLNRLREMHHGQLYDSNWGARGSGEGPLADQLRDLFEVTCRKLGLNQGERHLDTGLFRRPGGEQLNLL